MQAETTHAPTPSAPNPAPEFKRPEAPDDQAKAGQGLAVAVHNVHRSFGDVKALNDLTIEVPEGRITVLLGPNGAGKTTAIRTITGALAPHEGHVRVFGLDPIVEGENVRSRCGIVSAKPALYDRLSGWHNLEYAAELYEVHDDQEAKIRSAAARFGIEHALDQPVGGFSTGMKTRLALARSVLHEPELLLFDEPTSGLDPESAQAVLSLIREMTANGSTVVMCTHHLAEAEGLADRIVMLEAGRDLIAGEPAHLTERYWPQATLTMTAEEENSLEPARNLPGVLSFTDQSPTTAELKLDDFVRVPDLVAALTAEGVRLTSVEPFQPSLEDLYFAVRKEARDNNEIGEIQEQGVAQ